MFTVTSVYDVLLRGSDTLPVDIYQLQMANAEQLTKLYYAMDVNFGTQEKAEGKQARPAPSLTRTPCSKISRRTVLVGLAAGGAMVVSGSLLCLASCQQPVPPPPLPSPPPRPGSTLLVYRAPEAGMTGGTTAVAWSPEGEYLASSGYDRIVYVWKSTIRKYIFTYHGHTDVVPTVAWSPKGKRIASGSNDHTVQVWNATDGENVYIYPGHSDHVQSVRWSPDGKRIASAGVDKTVQVWDATDGGNAYTYRGHSNTVWKVVLQKFLSSSLL